MANILTELGAEILWKARARWNQLQLAVLRSRALTFDRDENGTVRIGLHPRRLHAIQRRDGHRHDAGVVLSWRRHPDMERHGARAAVHLSPDGCSDLTLCVRLPLFGYLHAGIVLPRELPPRVKRWILREPLRSTVELGVWLGPLADDWQLGLHFGDPDRYDYAPELTPWRRRPIEIPVDPRRLLLGRLLRIETSKVVSDEILPLPDRLYPVRVELCRYRKVRERLAHFAWAGESYYSNTVHFLDEDGVDTGHRKDPIDAVGASGENAQEAIGCAVGHILSRRKRYGWEQQQGLRKAINALGVAVRRPGLGWLAVTFVIGALYLGALLRLPRWLIDASPVSRTTAPSSISVAALAVMTVIAVGITMIAGWLYRRRDVV